MIWDEGAWPVVRVGIQDGSDDRYLWILEKFETLFTRGQRYVVLIDATELSSIPSAATRHALAKWQQRHDAETRQWCVGAAIVIASRLVRGALTALEWVQRPSTQHSYPASRREALNWCIARADEAGLAMSDAARAILKSNNG